MAISASGRVSPLFFARQVAVGGVEVDHLIAFHNAEPRSALPFECNDFHERCFLAVMDHSQRAATIVRGPDWAKQNPGVDRTALAKIAVFAAA